MIVENLKRNPTALGIFGFNFLVVNRDLVQAVKINNIEPSFDSISSKTYKLSRPLFVYFKKEHLDLVKGTKEFLQEIISKDTIGADGYLLQKGLIPLTNFELKKVRDEVGQAINQN